MRVALSEAALVLLTGSRSRWSTLKAWGMGIAKRRGMQKAVVADGSLRATALRVQEGAGRRGAQACSDTPRDVEDERGVPAGAKTQHEQHVQLIRSNGASPPGRMARIRLPL